MAGRVPPPAQAHCGIYRRPSLDGGDLAELHDRARQVAAGLGARVFLVGPDGDMPLHTGFPFGTDTAG